MTERKERPMLMSGPMVRAMLSHKKTETRRIIKPRPFLVWSGENGVLHWQPEGGSCKNANSRHTNCRYGLPGDTSWIRETFCEIEYKPEIRIQGKTDIQMVRPPHWIYRANWMQSSEFEPCLYNPKCPPKWKPSIFMPRAACRLTREIKIIKVEKVRDITQEGALCEGMSTLQPSDLLEMGASKIAVIRSWTGDPTFTVPDIKGTWAHFCFKWPFLSYRGRFRLVWSLMHPGSWERNDWVWVVRWRAP